MMSNSDEDCVVIDTLISLFLLLIKRNKYQIAKVIYEQIKAESEEDDEFLSGYISSESEEFTNIELFHIITSLDRHIQSSNLSELLDKKCPIKLDGKRHKL